MLVLFTQRSLGKLLGSRSHGRRRLGPPDLQIRHKRPGWPQEVWLYLPPCPFSGPDGRLPSLWAPLTPPKPAHPAVTHWTPQDFQCHSPKTVSNPERIFCPLWLLTVLKVTFLRAQSHGWPLLCLLEGIRILSQTTNPTLKDISPMVELEASVTRQGFFRKE